VVIRQRFRGRIWSANPAIVVKDAETQLAVWLPPKRHWQGRVGGTLLGDWSLGERVSGRGGILRTTRPGEAYSLLHFFNPDGSFRGWYFNFEGLLLRTPLGFDFEDEILDLWVERDRSWKWLDEDELEEALRGGIVERGEAAALRERGNKALAQLDALLPTGWEDWRPDPGWGLPELPPGWDAG
jgi:Protein of unknown function (DUF402)